MDEKRRKEIEEFSKNLPRLREQLDERQLLDKAAEALKDLLGPPKPEEHQEHHGRQH